MHHDEAVLREMYEVVQPKVVRSNDVPAYAALFDEEATWCPNGGIERHGPRDIAVGYAAVIADTSYDPTNTAIDIRILGNYGWVFGHNRIRIIPHEGAESIAHSREIWLFRKRHDWKIWNMIWNIVPEKTT